MGNFSIDTLKTPINSAIVTSSTNDASYEAMTKGEGLISNPDTMVIYGKRKWKMKKILVYKTSCLPEALLSKFASSLKEKYDKDRQNRFRDSVNSFIEKRDPTNQEQKEYIKKRGGISKQEVYFVSKRALHVDKLVTTLQMLRDT